MDRRSGGAVVWVVLRVDRGCKQFLGASGSLRTPPCFPRIFAVVGGAVLLFHMGGCFGGSVMVGRNFRFLIVCSEIIGLVISGGA